MHKPNAPVRHRKLMNILVIKKGRKIPKEQETKQVIKCLRRKLAWYNQSNVKYDSSEEQYSVLPVAIVGMKMVVHVKPVKVI